MALRSTDRKSASCWRLNGIEKVYSSASGLYDRFYLGIAVSDTPVGPFVLASSENVYGDATQVNPDGEIITSINPPILLDKKCDEYFYNDDFKQQEDFSAKDEIFSVIDTHPVVLEDGLYIYFVKHISTGSLEGNTIWAMKMKDMITPDYSTISMIIGNAAHWVDGTFFVGTEGRDVVRVEYKGEAANDPNYEANKDNPNYCINDPAYPRHLATSWIRYTTYADGTQKENSPNGSDLGVVEGQQVLTTKDKDGKTVYILTYACRGVDNYLYDLRMAYSYNPLHGFVKPTEEQGATILGVDAEVNDFMSNLAHVQFLQVDGELWICHAERMAPFSGADMGGLTVAVDDLQLALLDAVGGQGDIHPIGLAGNEELVTNLHGVADGDAGGHFALFLHDLHTAVQTAGAVQHLMAHLGGVHFFLGQAGGKIGLLGQGAEEGAG